MIQRSDELSPREIQLQQHEKEMFDKQAEQVLAVKNIELELAKLEAKWSSWLRVPKLIVLLPVYCLLAVGFIVGSFRADYEPGQRFWDLFSKGS